jgi:hypothetical protein
METFMQDWLRNSLVITALTLGATQFAHASRIVVPPLPSSGLEVLPPNHPFLLGKAEGTQNYVCLPAAVDGSGKPAFAWKLFTPEATLFSDDAGVPRQLITHFFSPNPDEVNADPSTDLHPIRATWQSSSSRWSEPKPDPRVETRWRGRRSSSASTP